MTAIDRRDALTREKRSSALSHYHGALSSLVADTAGEEIPQRVRTFTQAAYDDILASLRALSGICDAAIVVHGAVGCAAAANTLAEPGRARWYSVNLSERDSILGSEEPLRQTILRAIAEGATVVFVVGTPVVAINNDDVHSVLLELANETATPVLHVNTDGFRSKTPLSGFDAAFHALLRLVEASAEREDFLNVAAVSENVHNLAAVAAALDALSISWNPLPRLSTLASLRKAGRARATVTLDADESEYLALGLEKNFAVPWLRAPAPVGLAATRRFLLAIGAAFGVEDKAEAYATASERSLAVTLAAQPLAGKRGFLQVDTALVEGFTALVRELGGEVAGLALTGVDLNNRAHLARLDALGDIPAMVAVGQPFEVANILARTPVDFYVGPEQVAFAARFGATPVSLRDVAYLGYAGMEAFAARIAAPTPDFRERIRPLYSEGWLKKTGNWYVKREVR
ncbi:MAG: nitrogenase component 1 [Azoarcus sp.]|jgi:nitrogenase molybdenum-iron protein alpha chain|nr:nitrogenase component 1 [Azoarcus sp.]